MIEINEIRKNYEAYETSKIVSLIKQSNKLREDVIPILIHEIKKRNLGKHYIDRIKADRRILSESELIQLKHIVTTSTCSLCDKQKPLYGIKYTTIYSLFVDYSITSYHRIICERCGQNAKQKSLLITSLFGWWSIHGIFRTPFILLQKLKSKNQRLSQSDRIIEYFIKKNIGEITLNNESPAIINKLLKRYNSKEKVINNL